MRAFFDAVEVFFDHLTSVGWTALAIALGFQLVKVLLRTVAWRNILAAAYPAERVAWPGVCGAYFAGVGINSIAPARAGDLVKLLLVHRRIRGSSYATLAPTLLVETLLDFVVASALVVWAFAIGALPSFEVLSWLPSVDWSWPLRHPRIALGIAAGLGVGAVYLLLVARSRVVDFWARVAQGFAILRDGRRFVRQVVLWQAASWVCRIAAIYWFLKAFDIPATVHNALLVQVVDSLSTLIPLTPGGAGTKQGLIVYVLLGEASPTALLSFSVGMNIAVVAFNVVLGAIALAAMTGTLRWRGLAARAEREAGAPL